MFKNLLFVLMLMLFSISCMEEEEIECERNQIFNTEFGVCVVPICKEYKEDCVEGCNVTKVGTFCQLK